MNILLNLLIFLLPFGVILRIKVLPNIYVYPIDVVVGGIFIFTIYNCFILKKRILNTDLLKIAFAFLITGFLSLLINSPDLNTSQFATSFAYMVRFIAYLSIFCAVQFLTASQKKNIINNLLISGIVFVIFSYIQYFFYKDLSNLFYLGWDSHLYRLFGTLLDPNFAGAYLSLIFLLICAKTLELIKSQDINKKLLLFYLVAGSATSIAVVLTYSRSALIMLFVGLFVLLVLNKMIKQLIICTTLIMVLVFSFSNFKIEGLNPFRIASSEARIRSANEAMEIISKSPIYGVGFNAYRYALLKSGMRSELGISESNADSSTDNSFLFVAATGGLISLAFYIKLLFDLVGKIIQKIRKSKSRVLAILALASLVAVMIDSIFINSLFYIFILSWLLIVSGIVLSSDKS